MKQLKYNVAVIVIMSVCMLCMTGCSGNFIKYHLREDPDEAMEHYLEEKYDDEITCIEWTTDSSFNFYWNKSGFSGDFESEKYPGVKIDCSASLKEGGMDYSFYDNYQKVVYLSDVQKLMEEIAAKYFEGEYYVVTQTAGMLDDETVEAMPFEEYVVRWLRYKVCIFVEDMNDEEALAATEKFVKEVEEKGFQSSFYVGRINTNIISKEIFLKEMKAEKEQFNPWTGNGKEDIAIWIYKKSLSLTEEGQE